VPKRKQQPTLIHRQRRSAVRDDDDPIESAARRIQELRIQMAMNVDMPRIKLKIRRILRHCGGPKRDRGAAGGKRLPEDPGVVAPARVALYRVHPAYAKSLPHNQHTQRTFVASINATPPADAQPSACRSISRSSPRSAGSQPTPGTTRYAESFTSNPSNTPAKRSSRD